MALQKNQMQNYKKLWREMNFLVILLFGND